MGWYCCYSVILKGTTNMVRSNNTACYAQWVTQLHLLDKVIIHISKSIPENGTYQTAYTNAQLIRYFRALQKGGLKFTFTSKGIALAMRHWDMYANKYKEGADVECFNIEIDVAANSHMNAQVTMHCMRFLYEKDVISAAFMRWLDEERALKKKTGISVFNKMLIAMIARPGSGHSFGANGAYNSMLSKEQMRTVITENPIKNPTTSVVMPKTRSCDGYAKGNLSKMIEAKAPFVEVLKVYKEQCAKYT